MLRKLLSYHPASFRSTSENFWWFIHNMFAHPASELLFWLGSERLGNKVHDWTIPRHEANTGRG